jgi:adenine-specific DNA methylase
MRQIMTLPVYSMPKPGICIYYTDKKFPFQKNLMEEHFNSNYMESSTYPKATFSGQSMTFQTGYNKRRQLPCEVSGNIIFRRYKKNNRTRVIEVRSGKPQQVQNLPCWWLIINKIPGWCKTKSPKEVAIEVSCMYEKK